MGAVAVLGSQDSTFVLSYSNPRLGSDVVPFSVTTSSLQPSSWEEIKAIILFSTSWNAFGAQMRTQLRELSADGYLDILIYDSELNAGDAAFFQVQHYPTLILLDENMSELSRYEPITSAEFTELLDAFEKISE